MFITRFKEMLMITQCATAAKFKSDFSVCFLPQLAYKLLQTCHKSFESFWIICFGLVIF